MSAKQPHRYGRTESLAQRNDTGRNAHVLERLCVLQVDTQDAQLSTFAQEEGLVLPLGSAGAWDEEALGHPVVRFKHSIRMPLLCLPLQSNTARVHGIGLPTVPRCGNGRC